jgi:site-specific DNA recombinase
MLLGITFAISKEYSDKLSENVMRGNRLSLEEGKYVNKPKHGYFKDKNNCLRPDEQNFVLIKECFQMRLAGKTLDEIAEFLADNNYQRMSKDKNKVYSNYKKNAVDRILKDPVYCGVLRYGNQIVNLTEIYDFIPMVTVDEFMRINHLKDQDQVFKMAKKFKRPDYKKSDLMSEMVYCGCCGDKMTTGITTKKTKKGTDRYFYYRCDNDFCQNKNKSVRARVILNYVYKYLDTKPFSSKEAYEHYKAEIKRVMDLRADDAQRERRTLVAQINKQKERAESIKDTFYKELDEIIKESFKKDLLKTEGEITRLQSKLDKVNEFLKAGKTAILTYEKFLELMDNMAQTLRNIGNMKELDFFMKKLYLNFSVTKKEVVKSTLNEPFEALSKLNISKCGRYRTRTCDLQGVNLLLYQLS